MVLIVSLCCYAIKENINYRIAALILLLTVSVIAMLFDIFPVLLSAFLSAVIWNFFFIQPEFTFDISSTEDLLMFISYFFIAMLNGVLTFKIRQAERKARDKEEKEKTIKLYNTLLSSLSHELRTPIATILGTVDTLKDSGSKLTQEQQLDLYNEIDIAGVRLNRQVENILNMSRLESGILKPKADWCDMQELISSTIQKMNFNIHHQIVLEENRNLPLFRLDVGFTEQIINNILHNATQYTPEKTFIQITVQHIENNCVVIISDNGGGFPESEIVTIFDKFRRLPNSKTGGSGLGLSIVKGFTETQGGKVSLKNNERCGATFTIEIPSETSYINNLKNE